MKNLTTIFLLFVSLVINSQTFTDVSIASGINHVYNQNMQMGGGAVFFDYDNDGWEDLYVTSGKGADHLYRNLGNGSFRRIQVSWLEVTEDYYTVAAVAGDLNNDGLKDLFVTTWQDQNSTTGNKRNLFFINNGNGQFTESGVSFGFNELTFSMGVSMLDYNQDGLLDIYVVNYVENVTINYSTGEVINDDCFPNLLYINNGNGTFTEISQSMSVDNTGCALAVMPTDYDQDGDQDIYIANDFGAYITPNCLFNNNAPTNSFTDLSESTNMNVGIFGMGVAYADIDKDNDFDYYITNLGRNVLIQNNGSQVFTDISTAAGVENTFTPDTPGDLFTTGWGTAFLDVNNDTWPDLFVANGRVPADGAIGTGETDPNKLYLNNGNATFADISVAAGIDDANRGRGMAYCDYDKDGDLDVFVVVQDGSADSNAISRLYRNNLNPNGSNNDNWIQFDLEGTTINKDAMGAKVKITVDGDTQIQEVHGQGSHCSQHSLVLHFGLEDYEVVDEVEVIWSKGNSQVFSSVQANQRYSLTQGGTLGLDDFSTNDQVKIYPNPTSDYLYLSNQNYDSYKITNTAAKTVLSGAVNSEGINVSTLPKGVYILTLSKDNKTIESLKFLVN